MRQLDSPNIQPACGGGDRTLTPKGDRQSWFSRLCKGAIAYIENKVCFPFHVSIQQPMQLEDYFDFLAPNDIRLKGTRVGIETILYDFIHRARTPEEIAQTYASLTLEQVYATILYYLHNTEVVSKYLADWLEWNHQQVKAQQLNPSPAAIRMRKLRSEQKKKVNDAQVSA